MIDASNMTEKQLEETLIALMFESAKDADYNGQFEPQENPKG